MLSVMIVIVPRNLLLGKTLAMCVNCLLAFPCQDQVRKCERSYILKQRANFIFNPWTQDCNRLWSSLRSTQEMSSKTSNLVHPKNPTSIISHFLGPFNFSEFPNKLNLGISVTIVDITDLYPTFL